MPGATWTVRARARGLRVPEGEVRRHPNGATGIAGVTVAVADVEASLARYRAFLGPDAVSGGEGEI